LASAPEGGFIPIPGYAPDALNMPTGCHFAPRCKSVHSQCEHKMPELFARGKGLARCFMDTSKKFEKGF
jgi:peptide/nickel transport system ATP-binding protein